MRSLMIRDFRIYPLSSLLSRPTAANGLSGQCPLITSPICTLIRSSIVDRHGEGGGDEEGEGDRGFSITAADGEMSRAVPAPRSGHTLCIGESISKKSVYNNPIKGIQYCIGEKFSVAIIRPLLLTDAMTWMDVLR